MSFRSLTCCFINILERNSNSGTFTFGTSSFSIGKFINVKKLDLRIKTLHESSVATYWLKLEEILGESHAYDAHLTYLFHISAE